MSGAGGFLERWSRLKRQSDAPAAPQPVETAAPAVPAGTPSPATEGPPELPPVDTLGLDSNFTAFLREEVSESLRRAALKKLFSDPHFNRMDGLDVYIDDYSVADPIPPDVLERLRHARELLRSEAPSAPEEGQAQLAGAPPLPPEGDEPAPADPDGTPAAAAEQAVCEGPSGQCDTLGASGQIVAVDEQAGDNRGK